MRCEQLAVIPRSVASYGQPPTSSPLQLEAASVRELLERSEEILAFLREQIPVPETETTDDTAPAEPTTSDEEQPSP